MNTKKVIYSKDKTIKITFRCDNGLSDWLTERSTAMKVTPSGLVRQLIYQQMYAEKTFGTALANLKKESTSTETAVSNANN